MWTEGFPQERHLTSLTEPFLPEGTTQRIRSGSPSPSTLLPDEHRLTKWAPVRHLCLFEVLATVTGAWSSQARSSSLKYRRNPEPAQFQGVVVVDGGCSDCDRDPESYIPWGFCREFASQTSGGWEESLHNVPFF